MSTATKDEPDTEAADANDAPPPEVNLTAAGDPTPPPGQPLILTDAYFELLSVNLRCFVKHLEIVPENKLVTISTFCAETDYPGVTKWHLRVTFAQSFDVGTVYATLNAAYQNYVATGAQVPFKARPYSSRTPSASNPIISGLAIPQPFEILTGDAGASSEVKIDWNMTAAPGVDTGTVAAAGAASGAPGYFTPSGAATPNNLAALTGITAAPATAWPSGSYVITKDMLASYWNGTAWTAGKAP
jgi:hypothetical protein